MKGSITPERIANQVMMFRTHHKGSFMIVEGSTDAKVFHNLVDQRKCRLVIAHSKYNATKGISLLDHRGLKGALAVVDADYWILEGIHPDSPNLFLTDTHDMETMLLRSPALEKALVEYLPSAQMERVGEVAEAVRKGLLQVGVPIGYLRWVSFREDAGLNLNTLQPEEFVDLKLLEVDSDRLAEMVKAATKGTRLTASELKRKVAVLRKKDADPWQIVQGHDLIDLMTIILPLVAKKIFDSRISKRIRRRSLNEKLEEDLRLAYQPSFFQTTRLCESIQEWESDSSPYKVMP
jgi:hypothetical protein